MDPSSWSFGINERFGIFEHTFNILQFLIIVGLDLIYIIYKSVFTKKDKVFLDQKKCYRWIIYTSKGHIFVRVSHLILTKDSTVSVNSDNN